MTWYAGDTNVEVPGVPFICNNSPLLICNNSPLGIPTEADQLSVDLCAWAAIGTRSLYANKREQLRSERSLGCRYT